MGGGGGGWVTGKGKKARAKRLIFNTVDLLRMGK